MMIPYFTLWHMLLFAQTPITEPDFGAQVVSAEADGWHYVVRKHNHYFVIQAGSAGRFQVGDRLQTLSDRTGEQWVLVNNTPRRTSVLVNGFGLSYDQAIELSAARSRRTLALVQ
jgi:hypothetical protein